MNCSQRWTLRGDSSQRFCKPWENLLPCLSVFRGAACEMPDQKGQSLDQWVDVDYVEDYSSFPKDWMSVIQCAHLVFLFWKKKNGAKKVRAGMRWCPPTPLFLYLFIYCYLLWFFCWHSCETKSKEGTQITCVSKKNLHCPKDLDSTSPCNLMPFYGLLVYFLAILPRMHSLHIKPCQVLAIIQAHSIRGTEKVTEQGKSQKV